MQTVGRRGARYPNGAGPAGKKKSRPCVPYRPGDPVCLLVVGFALSSQLFSLCQSFPPLHAICTAAIRIPGGLGIGNWFVR